jgi:hypothetical protein
MEKKDGSDWFTSTPKPLENAVELARNFLEPAIMQAIYEACRDILGERPTINSVNEAVAAAISIAEEVWRDLQSESPPYACEKGCSWCCHQTVMVIAPEVLSVKAYLQLTFDAEEVQAMRDRLAVQTAQISGRSTPERQSEGISCGLLADSACSLHPGRPLPCRGGFSADAGFCQDLFQNFVTVIADVEAGAREGPFMVVPKTLFNSGQVALTKAFKDVGYECRPLELTAALEIALSRPNIAEEWLVDESVFAAAELNKIDGHYVTNVR